MTARILFFLPREESEPIEWCRVTTEDVVVEKGVMHRGDTPGFPEEHQMIGVVPGEAATASWIEMEGATPAQRNAAAKYRISDRLATAPGNTHITVADEAGAEGNYLAVAVDTAIMSSWLARLAEHGLDAEILIPDHLLFPATKQLCAYQVTARRLAIRSLENAFTAEADLARLVLGCGALPEPVSDTQALTLMIAGSAHPAINLCSGTFARTERNSFGPGGRRLLLWALAIPLLLLAGAITHLLRTDAMTEDIRYETEQLALDTLPPGTDRAKAVERLLSGQNGGGNSGSFTATSDALFEAVRSVPGARVEALQWTEGRLGADLFLARGSSAESLRPIIEGSGYALVANAMQPAPGGFRASIEVTAQ